MRRAWSFAALAVAALVILVSVVVWYLGTYQPPGGSVTGVMGQMMGSDGGSLIPMPGWVWASLAVLVAVVLVGAAGVAYYATYPEIRTRPDAEATVQKVMPSPARARQDPGMSWSTLLRTSKPEEKKVLDVLAAHDGRYLQKFIVKESGLSRLKTHRILSRFAERGIVVAEKSGNTNEVALAAWLRPETDET